MTVTCVVSLEFRRAVISNICFIMDGNIYATLIMITLCFLYVHGLGLIVSLNDVGFIIMIKEFEYAIIQEYANVTLVIINGLIGYSRMEVDCLYLTLSNHSLADFCPFVAIVDLSYQTNQ